MVFDVGPDNATPSPDGQCSPRIRRHALCGIRIERFRGLFGIVDFGKNTLFSRFRRARIDRFFAAAAAIDVERRRGFQQSGGLEVIHARKVTDFGEPEVIEKLVGRAPGHRPARTFAPAFRFDPVLLEQQVEGAFAEADAASRKALSERLQNQ